jgi:hypothetical protein
MRFKETSPMPDTAQNNLNNHHLDTLTAILSHPVNHNIEWKDVLSLLEAVGKVQLKHDGKYSVKIGEEQEVFERPRGKDIDTQQVVDLRRMLSNAGYSPKQAGTEI